MSAQPISHSPQPAPHPEASRLELLLRLLDLPDCSCPRFLDCGCNYDCDCPLRSAPACSHVLAADWLERWPNGPDWSPLDHWCAVSEWCQRLGIDPARHGHADGYCGNEPPTKQLVATVLDALPAWWAQQWAQADPLAYAEPRLPLTLTRTITRHARIKLLSDRYNQGLALRHPVERTLHHFLQADPIHVSITSYTGNHWHLANALGLASDDDNDLTADSLDAAEPWDVPWVCSGGHVDLTYPWDDYEEKNQWAVSRLLRLSLKQ